MTTAITAEVKRIPVPALLLAAATVALGGVDVTTPQPSETATRDRVRAVQVVDGTSGTALTSPSEVLSGGSLATASASSLLALLSSPLGSLALRVEVLEELAARRDQNLASVIANRLCSFRLNPGWRSALVFAAEQVGCVDPELRASLAAGLFRSALFFRDETSAWSDPPLWAAVRTLGGIVEAPQSAVFLEFLRTSDRIRTRQVALQALQSILARDPGAAVALPGELKARVGEIARFCLNQDWLISGENISLAANAFCAAVLAETDGVAELRSRLRDARRPALERQVELAMARARGEQGPRV